MMKMQNGIERVFCHKHFKSLRRNSYIVSNSSFEMEIKILFK